METSVRKLFEKYEQFFATSLGGHLDTDAVASIYASEFIAASPAGVRTGKNDDQFVEAMTRGYQYYRAIGTKGMHIRSVRITSIDEHHCVAHVAWTAVYERKDQAEVSIDFDVHYLVQNLNGEPRIFGWVAGDEQAVLKKYGIV